MSLADDYVSLLQRYGMSSATCAPEASSIPSGEDFATEVALALNAQFPGGRRAEAIRDRPEATELRETLKKTVLPRLEDYRRRFSGGFMRKLTQTLLGDYESLIKESLTDEQRLTVENVGVFEFPTASTNAHSIATASGFLCLINSGLLELIHQAAVQFFSAVPIATIENDSAQRMTADFGIPDEPHSVPAIVNAAGWVGAVIFSYLRFAESGIDMSIKSSHENDINEGLLNLSLHIERAMGCFVVAHELAHVMLGHHEQKMNILTPVGSLPVLGRSHEEEYEADRFATHLLVSLDRRGLYQNGSLPLACGGPAFFYLHMIVQRIERALPDIAILTSEDSSHPASDSRAERVLSWLEKEYSASELSNDQQSMRGVRIFTEWIKMFATLFHEAIIEPTGIQVHFK